ncbi:extracellular solute-binding protein [Paenibacillus thermotolerans]|uniref:extracellular solute-binding protein n=1 Tax=Paenibacillus thermotolerans TaxID=3027807 RepID=UPI002368AFC9|nr:MULTISPECIES: extracellular solute-binding protein [unclassified Paenibacillus]
MRRRRRLRTIAIAFSFLLVAALFIGWRMSTSESAAYPELPQETLFNSIGTPNGIPSYIEWQRSESVRSMPAADGLETTVLATDYSAASEEADIAKRHDDTLSSDVIDWNNADGWLEWEMEAPADGLYELIIHYAPIPGSYSQIVRGIQIDGQFPFAEAERIGFERMWQDSKYPYDRNSINNEIRPVQTEWIAWNKKSVSDFSLSSEPLRWSLTKGTHTIRLVGVSEPISLYSITLASPENIPAYSEYAIEHRSNNEANLWYTLVEAERFAYKSAPGIRTISVNEPYASPDPQGRIVYNALGGSFWQRAGESVTWEIEVPETGHYAIDLKYFQGYNGNANAYRTIAIDGKVPFREMLHYRFPPNIAMEISPLSDENGSPYLFYLPKGTHRLTMTADNSLIRPVILALGRLNERLSDIERKVRVISGNYGYAGSVNLDTARVWEMEKYDPNMEEKLQKLKVELKSISDYLKGLNQGSNEATTALDGAVSRLGDLLEDVNNLPNEVSAFAEIKSGINTWTQSIENQPMHLDYIVVRTPNADPGLKVPGLWDKVQYSTVNFVRTFFQKYDTDDSSDDEALTVWVQRGRDYVDLLEAMIEQDFTPKTGIKVNLNLVPSQNVLLMSTAAGQQPDVALGAGMEVPADFAMRGAALELSAFDDFEEVSKRFNPGVMRSYAYDGKVYALPETATYNMLFVRTDILEELGLEPPDTWEDVLDMLPALQENGMTFMFPKISTLQEGGTSFMTRKPDFITPYYQHGAEFYTSDGLLPQLNSEEGFAAFKMWSDWFAKYDLPKDVPEFFNHFRFGGMPAGVGDISMYIQLSAAAPELAGHWKMLPIPGMSRSDGTVERWTSQGVASAMILKASDKKEQAWEFLKWWTSDDVQGRYGRDIESFAGIAYRWNTANIHALQTLPWAKEDLLAINEQWRWAKNMPFVPGYYMLPREMDFAWNETLLNGTPPREALEDSQMSLLREMLRKQLEFGIKPGDDLDIAPYDKPYGKE